MRALLIVNPRATSTTQLRRDVIVHALASELDLEVVETRYRGDAARLAAEAAAGGRRLVLTLGGDGTVNEAVNGLLSTASAASPAPAFAALPGGNANVFTRALGMPTDLVDATGRILHALATGRYRSIGLGLAGDRYFTFNAGVGFDAEVVRAVDGLRAHGRPASPALYLWTAVRHFYSVTNRREPALTLERPGQPGITRLYFGIISNASPWTYLGRRPVTPTPQAGFETGLDVFAVRGMGTLSTLSALRQMLAGGAAPPHGRQVVNLHDEAEFTVHASRPVALQVDGEYVGERECVHFRSVPDALRVLA